MDMHPPHVDDYQFLHSSFHHPQWQLQQCYDCHDHEINFHPSDKSHEQILICHQVFHMTNDTCGKFHP